MKRGACVMAIMEAKKALDNVMQLGRVHWYKPIQIAEILYKHRLGEVTDLKDLNEYRTKSRHWRDVISQTLVGRKSTSSAKYQDDIFSDTAMPPHLLYELGNANSAGEGIVEAYIYAKFAERYEQMMQALDYVRGATAINFNLEKLLEMFWHAPGLRRSIDKVYEAVVYALFDSLVDALDANVTLTVDKSKRYLVEEYEEFSRLVLGVTPNRLEYTQEASLFRVGVTNASDRGLDMWANFGPAVQIKHLTLNVEMAESIVGEISADRMVIVCKDCDKDTLTSIMCQIGWGWKVQGIIVESQLIEWYEKALRGQFSNETAENLLKKLIDELETEFPLENEISTFWNARGYGKVITDSIWTLK